MNSLKKVNLKALTIDFFVIFLGCAMYALSINCFTDPNNISPGGVTGIGQLFESLTGFHKGQFCLLLNLPIFLWAFIELNWRGLIRNLFATFMLNVLVDVHILPIYKGDLMIASILAGVVGGAGLGLVFIKGAATGGTDLLATLTKIHIPHIPVGKILLFIDGAVVVTSAIVYSFRSDNPYAIVNGTTYAVILLFIQSKIIDALLHKSSAGTGKIMFIISQKSDEIARRILVDLNRGVTAIKSRGMYTAKEGEVLMSAVTRQEVHKTYNIIKSIDKNAFIIVGDAGEITGLGFKELDKGLEKSILLKKLESRKSK